MLTAYTHCPVCSNKEEFYIPETLEEFTDFIVYEIKCSRCGHRFSQPFIILFDPKQNNEQ